MMVPVADPNALAEFEAEKVEKYKRDLSQTKWRELEGFWTDKTDAERDALWPHYRAAERLVNLKYKQPKLYEAFKEYEAAMGLTWRQISYAPRAEYDENDPSHSECAACDARREEIAGAKAKGEVYFAPPWLDR